MEKTFVAMPVPALAYTPATPDPKNTLELEEKVSSDTAAKTVDSPGPPEHTEIKVEDDGDVITHDPALSRNASALLDFLAMHAASPPNYYLACKVRIRSLRAEYGPHGSRALTPRRLAVSVGTPTARPSTLRRRGRSPTSNSRCRFDCLTTTSKARFSSCPTSCQLGGGWAILDELEQLPKAILRRALVKPARASWSERRRRRSTQDARG